MLGFRITSFTLIATALLFALLPLPVAAQVAVQQWRPSTEAGGFAVIEPPVAPVGYGFGLSLWTQYAREPVVVPVGDSEAVVVNDQVTLDITGTVGLLDWLALSLGVPSTVYQGSGIAHTPSSYAGMGDPRLLAKFILLRPGVGGQGLGVALIPELGLPFGDRRTLLTERNFTFTPRATLGYQLGTVLVVVNAGYRFREGAPLGELLVDDELLLGAGVEVPVPGAPLALTFELVSATATVRPYRDLRDSSLEAFLSARARLGSVSFQPGLAVGLTPGYLVPDFRLFAALAWAPRYRDADGDGIADHRDACFSAAEDFDDHLDDDGCPELDNDGDGIRDAADRCPDLAGPDMRAGCP